MMKREMTEKRSYEGVVVVVLLSIALIVVGGMMFWYPERVRFDTFCQTAGVVLTAFGVVKICLYFIQQRYRSIMDYSFTAGLIIASAGVSGIANAEALGANGTRFLGMLVLADAVVMIQYALQIKIMDGKGFLAAALMAAGVYVFAMLAIAEPGGLFELNQTAFSLLTAVSGVFGLVTMGLTWLRSRSLKREEERDSRRLLEEEPVVDMPLLEPETVPELSAQEPEMLSEPFSQEREAVAELSPHSSEMMEEEI